MEPVTMTDSEFIAIDINDSMPPPPPFTMTRQVSVTTHYDPNYQEIANGYTKKYHTVVSTMNLSKELPTYVIGTALDSTIVLDETGSMRTMGDEPVQSAIAYIEGQEQSGLDGLSITVIRFNESIIYTPPLPLTDPTLKTIQYTPNGMTALFDAIVFAILTAEKPQHVVIVTDGENNSSVTTLSELNTLIQRAESCGWIFTYIGCTLEAFEQGTQIRMSSQPICTDGCNIDLEGDAPPPPTLRRAMTSASNQHSQLNRERSI